MNAGTRIRVVAGPWPERIGAEGVVVPRPKGPAVYPWPMAPGQVAILLDDDPLVPAEERRAEWSCVIGKAHLKDITWEPAVELQRCRVEVGTVGMPGPAMTTATTFDTVDWVRANTSCEISDDAARCLRVLCSIARVYNLPLIGSWSDAANWRKDLYAEAESHDDLFVLRPVEIGDDWVVARLHGSLATFDFANLTALVVAAHDEAVRVDVGAEMYLHIDTDSTLSHFDAGEGRWVDTDEHPRYTRTCLRVQLNARQREGDTYHRHPTLEEAAETWRKS